MNANSKLPSLLDGTSMVVAALGTASLAVGVMLLAFTYQPSNLPFEQLGAVAGRFTDHAMWSLLVGSLAAVGGAFLLLAGRWRS